MTVYKSKDGTYRWVLLSSNSFEDRDQEIVSQKALERDVERADRDGDYGNLRWWHTNSDLGPCDFNMMYGRMCVESGTFHDWRVGERVKENPEALEVSLGFRYPRDEPDAEGVFHNIHRFERSLLPRGFASNPYTSVHLLNKESGMPTLEEKEKAFSDYMQVDLPTGRKMLRAALDTEKAALDSNARHKEADAAVDPCVQKHIDAGKTEEEAKAMCAADKAEAAAAVAEDKGMTKKEFDAALTAVVGELEATKARMHILETATAEKATRDAATATDVAATKETADKAWQLAQELNGTLPRKLGDPLAAYRPSTHGAAPTEDKLKQVTPEHDPWAKHLAGISNSYPQKPPGM